MPESDPISVEHLPNMEEWQHRFHNVEPVREYEGGAVFTAEDKEHFVVVVDEATMADLLPPEEAASLQLVTVFRFASEEGRDLFVALRHPGVIGTPVAGVLLGYDIDPLRVEQWLTGTAVVRQESLHIPFDVADSGDQLWWVDSCRQVVFGDPIAGAGLAVATFYETGDVEVAEFAIEWTGPGSPRPRRKTGTLAVLPTDFGTSAFERAEQFTNLLEVIFERRWRRFQRCGVCGQRTPPESLAEPRLCQRCGTEKFGFVY